MFDAIKSILYLEQRVQERQRERDSREGARERTEGAQAPGACHKNDLAPAGPGYPTPYPVRGIKMILRQVLLLRPTVVVSIASCC